MLHTSIGTLSLDSPLLTASGTFGHDPAALAFLEPGDLGALVLKTVTPEARHGNPPPRMLEFTGGVMNSIGLENKGLDYWRQHVAPQLEQVSVPVVANAGGHSAGEYAQMVEAFDAMKGVSAIELNLSCPNVKGGTQFSTDATALAEVVRACRKLTAKPMWVKLSPNVGSIAPLAKAAEEAGADALTVCNTIVGMLVDWRTRKPRLGNGIGGMSGPAVRPVATRLVWESSNAVQIPVIASGGAESADDVLDFMVAGATAVQIGTASFRRPDVISRIAKDLRQILTVEDLKLADMHGTLQWPAPVSC
jgi:dihydroorotate dehydrogenase (NAD+) catalytic subunit